MKKIVSLTLLCLLYGTAAVAQTLEISIKKHTTDSGFGTLVAVIELNGDLTAGNVALFNSKASEALKISRYILINMEKVDQIDEASLIALQTLKRNVDKVKGQLKLCCMQPMVKLVFEVGALDTVFDIFRKENDALSYF